MPYSDSKDVGSYKHIYELKDLKLTDESKKSLFKVYHAFHGNLATSLENGLWYIPTDSEDTNEIIDKFKKDIRKSYRLSDDRIFELESFNLDTEHDHKNLNKNLG